MVEVGLYMYVHHPRCYIVVERDEEVRICRDCATSDATIDAAFGYSSSLSGFYCPACVSAEMARVVFTVEYSRCVHRQTTWTSGTNGAPPGVCKIPTAL
jgi:hypothetical protein